VGANLPRCPACDDLAEVEHGHLVRQSEREVHVMLDQQYGDARGVMDLADHRCHCVNLIGGHPGHGLIQEQQSGPGGKRPGDLDPLLDPVR
jgi:hypothetical protein